MQLALQQVFDIVGERLPFDYQLDLAATWDDASGMDTCPFVQPVHVFGTVENTAGIVTLTIQCQTTIRLSCDRCLAMFERPLDEVFEHILVQSVQSEDEDYIVLADACLDLDELVRADILLSFPSKVLCRDDCKGLCDQCGANLNETQCDCKTVSVDPRLEALGKFLT